jgi:hypothetical protein
MSQQCCFQSIALNKKQSLIHVPCIGIAQQNGYCTEHQYAAHLLDKARFYGCPEIVPPVNKKTKKQEDGLIIRQGLHNWQNYCECVSPGNAKRMSERLDEAYGKLFKRGVA